jgi:hypothetical protein
MIDLYPKSKDIEKVLSPLPATGNGYYDPQETAWANVCEDVPANIKENLLNGGEGPDLTNGPLKSKIVRCPVCGSSNVHLGIKTIDGVPMFCKSCETFFPVKRGNNEEM